MTRHQCSSTSNTKHRRRYYLISRSLTIGQYKRLTDLRHFFISLIHVRRCHDDARCHNITQSWVRPGWQWRFCDPSTSRGNPTIFVIPNEGLTARWRQLLWPSRLWCSLYPWRSSMGLGTYPLSRTEQEAHSAIVRTQQGAAPDLWSVLWGDAWRQLSAITPTTPSGGGGCC